MAAGRSCARQLLLSRLCDLCRLAHGRAELRKMPWHGDGCAALSEHLRRRHLGRWRGRILRWRGAGWHELCLAGLSVGRGELPVDLHGGWVGLFACRGRHGRRCIGFRRHGERGGCGRGQRHDGAGGDERDAAGWLCSGRWLHSGLRAAPGRRAGGPSQVPRGLTSGRLQRLAPRPQLPRRYIRSPDWSTQLARRSLGPGPGSRSVLAEAPFRQRKPGMSSREVARRAAQWSG